jgi:hypothetical protein
MILQFLMWPAWSVKTGKQTDNRESLVQSEYSKTTSNLTILSLIILSFGPKSVVYVHHSNTPAVARLFQSVVVMFRRCHCSSKKPNVCRHIDTMIMLLEVCCCSVSMMNQTLKRLLLILSILFFWLQTQVASWNFDA